jgi:hypothetical protein
LNSRKLKAPYIPDITEADNFEFFDSEFTSEGFFFTFYNILILEIEVKNSQVPKSRLQMIEDYQDEFKDFTYDVRKKELK